MFLFIHIIYLFIYSPNRNVYCPRHSIEQGYTSGFAFQNSILSSLFH